MSDQKEVKLFEVNPRTLQAVMQYLVTKPFAEVAQLIQALDQSTPIFVEDKEE